MRFLRVWAEMNINGAVKDELVPLPHDWDSMSMESRNRWGKDAYDDVIPNLVESGYHIVEATNEDDPDWEDVEES